MSSIYAHIEWSLQIEEIASQRGNLQAMKFSGKERTPSAYLPVNFLQYAKFNKNDIDCNDPPNGTIDWILQSSNPDE
ncbi:MAG: hypothetical protein H0U57_04025 [Tatlockia sp.]|nr:hypothetical protein [Tatlockia sp.]